MRYLSNNPVQAGVGMGPAQPGCLDFQHHLARGVALCLLVGQRRGQAAVGDGVAFERDGSKEFIRATNGVGTSMKWLAEKNCLDGRPGEGWCRH